MAEPPVRAAAVPSPDEPAGIDFGDLQGLVRFGHGRLSEACFLLLKVADPEAAEVRAQAGRDRTGQRLSIGTNARSPCPV